MPDRIIEIPYSPRSVFLPYHNRSQRWACIVAHRRFGKTVGTLNDLIKRAILCTKKEPRFAYIAPFYAQAKDVVWSYLRHYTSGFPDIKVSESELFVEFPHNGARIRLYGAENYDRMRGIYLDGVVIDEPADMSPRAWPEVIRPALSDRLGFATFIGTPKGKDAFYQIHKQAIGDPEWYSLVLKSSETGVIAAPELESAKRSMTEEQYQREFEVNFDAPVPGAYYAREMLQMRKEGRYCRVPHTQGQAVHTFWDLGVDDATAILMAQFEGREIRIIDSIEGSGEGIAYYLGQLRERSNALGYSYGSHFWPHDGNQRELMSGLSRAESARKLGLNVTVLPQHPLSGGIESTRKVLSRCLIDSKQAINLMSSLEAYTKEYVEERGVFREKPLHNWASHMADAMRYLSCAVEMNMVRDKALDAAYRANQQSFADGLDYNPLGRNEDARAWIPQ